MKKYRFLLLSVLLFASSNFLSANENHQSEYESDFDEYCNINGSGNDGFISPPPAVFSHKEISSFLPQIPKVNVVTGEYHEEEVDFVLAGCEPLSIRRFYSHLGHKNQAYGHWTINPEALVLFNFKSDFNKHPKLMGSGEENGNFIICEKEEGGIFSFDPSKHKNFTNTGYTHPLNMRFSYKKIKCKHSENYWEGVIENGIGGKKFFRTKKSNWDFWSNTAPIYQACVKKEIKPNGNIIHYDYEDINSKYNYEAENTYYILRSISAYSSKGAFLGSLQLDYSDKMKSSRCIQDVSIRGSDGRGANLHNHIREVQTQKKVYKKGAGYERPEILDVVLDRVDTPSKPTQNYNYRWEKAKHYFDHPYMFYSGQSDGRVLETTYDLNSKKVTGQNAPVGPNGEILPIARYEYQNDHTIVYDAENNKIIYRFNEDKRITAIEKYESDQIYSVEKNDWNAENGNLLKKTIEDGCGQIVQTTEYEYDKKYNPIKEITGDGNQSTTTIRTYSLDDGFNLLLSKTFPNEKKVVYNYVLNTNLLSSEFIYDHKKICKRKFNFYHEELQAFCVKTIIDDGNTEDPYNLKNVTYRKIVEYKPKLEVPCIGFPEEILEKAIDESGNEILLKRICYTYHPSGKIEKEDHYDAKNEYCFTLTNEYDANERLSATIDALGNRTLFGYDANFNLISQKGDGINKQWSYDLVNRPIKIIDGEVVSQNIYDRASRLTAMVDPSGFTTSYEYDSLGRAIAIHHHDGGIERKEYDILGNVTKEIDANGCETTKTYNFKGQPLSVSYSDGSQETFSYDIDTGNLITHIDQNGTKTVYAYDVFDNPIKTEVYSSSGKLLKKTSASYSAFNKLSETDAEGITTTYSYDYVGRKIAEKTLDRLTLYFYDSLGRQYCTQQDETITINLYDLKDQLIEKRVEDLHGNLYFQEKYDYDGQGKLTETITCEGGSKTVYNDRGQPIKSIDPLGNETEIFYSYEPSFTKTTRNPKCIVTIEKHDSRTRLQEIEVKDAQGKTIQKREKLYDLAGNQTHAIEHIYQGTQFLKTITNEWSYGPNNRIERLIESGEKETNYLYDAAGRLKTTIKPDQTKLHREYDDLGRLKRYYSQDFDYAYTYDQNDRVLKVYDGISRTSTTRTYDLYGNVIQETLANGLTLQNVYDTYGKKTCLTLSDGSKIDYSYKGDFLNTVTRNGYACTYERNLAGKKTSLILPNQLGEIKISYDPALRWKKYFSPYFKADYSYDSVGNLTQYNFEDPIGKENRTYTYDPLNQLIAENDHDYSYDSLYNRISKDAEIYKLNDLSQILHDGNQSYEYDRNGNLIQDGQRSYHYDSLDRLISVVENGWAIANYTYDPFNRRIYKNSESFIWDGQNEIGTSGKLWGIKELRVLGEGFGAEIGAAVIFELNGSTYFPIHDHRGSLVTMVYTNGKTYDTCRYTAFGEELTKVYYSPWRFASKRFDLETGFIYFGRRYYNPNLGRWVTADPQGFEDGPNLYAYVHNCPLTDFDPYGLWSWRNAVNNCDRGLDWGVRTALPLTYACGNNFFIGIPTAIFETALWIGMGTGKGAALAGKGFTQIAESAFARSATRNSAKNMIQTSEKAAVAAIEAQIARSTSRGEALFSQLDNVEKNLSRFKHEVNGIKFDLDALSKSGQALDRGGLTKAGRALDKHGGRPNSAFPKATGNAIEKNAQGQFHLDDIITHPNGFSKFNKFGGTDYYTPEGIGVRFYEDGTFRGFLEPNL